MTKSDDNNDESMSEEADDAPPSPPPAADADMVSPPGMRMRSGRKKRRRSKETSGLTPPEATIKRKSRASPRRKKQKGEDEDDAKKKKSADEEESSDNNNSSGSEEQTDTDDEDMEDVKEGATVTEAQKAAAPAAAEVPVPAAASIPVAASIPAAEEAVQEAEDSSSPKKKKTTTTTLRLPSQQTPGKSTLQQKQRPADTPYDNRYQGRVALEEIQNNMADPPSVNRVTQGGIDVEEIVVEHEQSGELPQTPVRRLFRSIKTTIKDIIVPQAEGLDLDDDDNSEHSSFVYKPYFWFILLLILQLVFFQVWINPILSTVSGVADQSILFYKDLLGVPPLVKDNITTIEIPGEVQTRVVTKVVKKKKETGNSGDEIVKHIEELAEAKDALADSTANIARATKEMTNQLRGVKISLEEKQKSLKAWDEALTEAETELKEMLTTTPDPTAVKKLQDASMMEVNSNVVPTANVPMWEVVSSSGCPQPPSSSETDPLVTKQDIEQGVAALKQRAQETVQHITKDPEMKETVKEFVQEHLEENDEFAVDTEDAAVVEEEEDDGPLIGLSNDEAKSIIADRIDSHLADMIGLMDVASLYNGAQVIRRGTRATTPSLVQSLPILNRLMAASKLRFYGHGAEAALSPTIPPDALGQCWSFENIAKSKNPRWRSAHKQDHANGKYASLTIRLARPTSIKRFIIDHVVPTTTSKPSSAIMDFRVIGYEDPNASGNPMVLGTFKFLDGTASQGFDVVAEEAKVQSLTLAIDSTYSKDYACLYRFRVLEE